MQAGGLVDLPMGIVNLSFTGSLRTVVDRFNALNQVGPMFAKLTPKYMERFPRILVSINKSHSPGWENTLRKSSKLYGKSSGLVLALKVVFLLCQREKGKSPTPSVSNLSLRPCRYLSTLRRSSDRASVDGFRRERLQRFATFDSLSVQRSLEAR